MAREPFSPIVINAVNAGHKVGEVRLVECTSCYAVVFPPHAERHDKYCPVRNAT